MQPIELKHISVNTSASGLIPVTYKGTLALSTIDSIFTPGGNVSIRNFTIATDLDSSYNVNQNLAQIKFNQLYNKEANIWEPFAGNIVITSQDPLTSSQFTTLNAMHGDGIYLEGHHYDNQFTNFFQVSPVQIYFEVRNDDLNEGMVFKMDVDERRTIISDDKLIPRGLEYYANYPTIINYDTSIPSVGNVKLLRQQANVWTTATRPALPGAEETDPPAVNKLLAAGTFGFNTTTNKFEGYTGSTWVDFH